VRDYAREALEANGDAETVRSQHAEYFARMAGEADAKSQGKDQEEWVAPLTVEQDNCQSALSWYIERGQGDSALGLAKSLARYWEARGLFIEGRRWLRQALAVAGTTTSLRARGLYCLGGLSVSQGDFAEAGQLFEESLALGRTAGDEGFVANVLNGLGATTLARGDHSRAMELFEESLSIRRRLGNRRGVAATLGNLGLVAEYQGRLDDAVSLYEESVDLNREMGNALGLATALENLARLESRRANFGRAHELVEESMAVSKNMGDPAGMASCLEILGEVALESGDLTTAAESFRDAMIQWRELGNRDGAVGALESLADVACERDEVERAAALWGLRAPWYQGEPQPRRSRSAPAENRKQPSERFFRSLELRLGEGQSDGV
jgi:tetratricopeptide (TPR) repeat protein